MVSRVQQKLADKQLPLVLAHRGGAAHGRENSIDAIKSVLPYKPDLIEIDVRKSKDGVLYCHHGSIPIGVSLAKLHRFLPFRQIQLFTGQRDTLEDVLKAIPEGDTVYLDLKDGRITADDLSPLLSARSNVWVSAWTIRHLRALRKGLGDEFVYILNRPLFRVDKGLEALAGVADSVHAFAWQWNDATRDKMQKAGIVCAHVHWFIPRGYKNGPRKTRSDILFHIYDDVSKTHRANS